MYALNMFNILTCLIYVLFPLGIKLFHGQIEKNPERFEMLVDILMHLKLSTNMVWNKCINKNKR